MKAKVKESARQAASIPAMLSEVQKAQAQAKRHPNRRVPPKLSQPDADVAQTQAQIEADSIESRSKMNP